GNEHDAVDVHALMLAQLTGKPGGAGGAVAFPDDELRRGPTRVSRRVEANEFSHGTQVALDTVEFLRIVGLDRSTESGADRVDEHEICFVEQGILVANGPIGRRERAAVILQLDAPRPEQSQVQPDRRRARTAVERKCDRAPGRITGYVLGV